jgi:hypothetical protein
VSPGLSQEEEKQITRAEDVERGRHDEVGPRRPLKEKFNAGRMIVLVVKTCHGYRVMYTIRSHEHRY